MVIAFEIILIVIMVFTCIHALGGRENSDKMISMASICIAAILAMVVMLVFV